MNIEFKDLVKSRVHFGHRTTRWHPKMALYIWGEKNNIHLIDIAKTKFLAERAAAFLEGIASNGLPVMWVGTKKAAQNTVLEVANNLKSPYVINRWIGGTLTNYSQVRKSVKKYLDLEEILSKSDEFSYTKKERNRFQKIVGKLRDNVGGIQDLKLPVGAVVIADIQKDNAAFKEAQSMGVPVVALVDTNVNPTGVDYPIPANDDAESSINFLFTFLSDAVQRGMKQAEKKEQAAKEKKAAEKAVKEKEAQDKKQAAKKATAKKEPAAEKKTVAKKAPETKAKAASSTKKTAEKKTPTKKTTEKKSTAKKAEKA